MRVNVKWEWWIRINMPLWFGYELGSPRVEKGVLGSIKPGIKGIMKGVTASIIPPIGMWYAYEVYRNWETCSDLN